MKLFFFFQILLKIKSRKSKKRKHQKHIFFRNKLMMFLYELINSSLNLQFKLKKLL